MTPLTLWDFSDANIAAITADDIANLAQHASQLAEIRREGRTAIVFNDDFDFGLGRMFETYLEMTGLPLEVKLFRQLDKARQWLGIDEGMIAGSMIYKIGSCVQKSETGALDRQKSLDLIQDLAVAIQSRQDQNILVDLREAEVQSDLESLTAFARECAKYKSGFDMKIAILIPQTEERVTTARRFKACMDVFGFRLSHFFDYDLAVEWLMRED